LDLQLSNIQWVWWQRYVISPDEETKRMYPLITQAGVSISLDHFGDCISEQGWISKLDGFLGLSARERKQLVSNTLELVKLKLYGVPIILVDKKTGRPSGKMLENRHIKLSMIISDVTKNDNNENIRLFLLPFEIGVGQAGYKDGQFVFSETYFLKLQVHDGLAASGDLKKFIVEHE
jgi:hypothetical protein